MPPLNDHEKARLRAEHEREAGLATDDAAARWLDAAENGRTSPLLAASGAGWKREPSTSAQVRLLRALGVSPLGLNRGEASAAISGAKQKRKRGQR